VELARRRKIPRTAFVISTGMSKERPWARIGNGPGIHVGDRMTVFDLLATMFLTDMARRSVVRAQRCLMDGGGCEATAYGAFGCRTSGLCLPLGNYHHIGANGVARAEYVSVSDLESLLRLTVAAVEHWMDFGSIATGSRARIEDICRQSFGN
jgi:putative aminopeptidase FrvX